MHLHITGALFFSYYCLANLVSWDSVGLHTVCAMDGVSAEDWSLCMCHFEGSVGSW